jgi:hypothetical protein
LIAHPESGSLAKSNNHALPGWKESEIAMALSSTEFASGNAPGTLLWGIAEQTKASRLYFGTSQQSAGNNFL